MRTALTITLFMLTACSTLQVAPRPNLGAEAKTVVIIPPINYSANSRLALTVADEIEKQFKQKKWKVITRASWRPMLTKKGMPVDSDGSKEGAVALAKAVGANYVVYGWISLAESAATNQDSGRLPHISLGLRLAEAANSQLVWWAAGSGKGAHYFSISKDPLGRVTEDLVADALDDL